VDDALNGVIEHFLTRELLSQVQEDVGDSWRNSRSIPRSGAQWRSINVTDE
jgi:hypothetical protein